MIHVDVSVLLPLHDAEASVAGLVREAATIAAAVVERPGGERVRGVEILALDERSGDNTASMLSVLHGQHPSLRTLQDLEPGGALRAAAKVARGDVWLVFDHTIDLDLAAWAVTAVYAGQPAAIVPGEVLALGRELGTTCFKRLDGGLVTAQRRVARHLRREGRAPAFSPAPRGSLVDRLWLGLRQGSATVGVACFDRPAPEPGELIDGLRRRALTLRRRLS